MTPIYDENLDLLMLVPDRWNIRRADFQNNGPLYSFNIDEDWRLIEISYDEPLPTTEILHRATIKAVNLKGTVYAVLVEGLEHLIDHPEVATLPRARKAA